MPNLGLREESPGNDHSAAIGPKTLSPEYLYREAFSALQKITNDQSASSKTDLLCKRAVLAGQLLAHPETFAIGSGALEDCYRQVIPIRSWREFEVVKEIVKQAGTHPDLRQWAVEIVFSLQSYPREEGHSTTTEDASANFRDLVFSSKELLVGPHDQQGKPPILLALSVVRSLKRVFSDHSFEQGEHSASGSLASRAEFKMDSDTASSIRRLVLDLVASIGDQDTVLSGKLLDSYMTLRQVECNAARARGEEWQGYLSQDLERLVGFKALRGKLEEITSQVRDKKEQGDAYFCLYRSYAEDGEPDKALDVLSRAQKITHVIYNQSFARSAVDKRTAAETLIQIRRIAGDCEVERLMVVGNAILERGDESEAKKVFLEAWKKSKCTVKADPDRLYQHHNRNVAGYFVDAARKTGLQFDGMGTEQLLNFAVDKAVSWFSAQKSGSSVNHWVTSFADLGILELTKSGRYLDAEKLVLLKDQKCRIEYWGSSAPEMRPEERDKGYMQMALGAAHRQDYDAIESYLGKMVEYRPDAALKITRLLGGKGDFENSFVASAVSANQIVSPHGLPQDRHDIGLARRILPFCKGEAILELGKAMLQHRLPPEKVGKALILGAQVGLDHRSLQEVVDLIVKNPALENCLLEVLHGALRNDQSFLEGEQHVVILRALRKIFPETCNLNPSEFFVNSN